MLLQKALQPLLAEMTYDLLLLFPSQGPLVAKSRQHQISVVPFPFNTVGFGIILVPKAITTEHGAPWIVYTVEFGDIVSSPNYAAVKVQMTY